MPIFAGVAETNITPPVGVWMSGYAGRPSGAIGIRDELFARALVLDNGLKRVALVAMDLIALDDDIVSEVRSKCAAALGVAPAAILLNCSHTHAGPLVKSYRCMGMRDAPYVDVLTRKLIGLVTEAAGRAQPARLTYGEASAQIGVNRRRSVEGGGTVLGANYAGPVAPIVQTLSVDAVDGRTFGFFFAHACHPTTLGGENLLISAEWPGDAVRRLRERIIGDEHPEAHDARPVVAFLQGCCGDINPHPRGTWENVEACGRAVASAAHAARWSARPIADERLDFDETTIELPLLPPPPVAECRRLVDESRAALDRHSAEGADQGRVLWSQGRLEWAQDALEIAKQGGAPSPAPFAIQRLTVGDVQILGLPAEMFVQYQLDFTAQTRTPVLSLGYSNGCGNYVPTAAEYGRGGYEVLQAYRFYGTLMYAPECEPIIRAAAYRLLGVTDPDLTPYPLPAPVP